MREKKGNVKEEEKKKLRKSVTKTEKSRYRDEFLIHFSRENIMYTKPLAKEQLKITSFIRRNNLSFF